MPLENALPVASMQSIWHWRLPKDKQGYEILTPHNQIWGRVNCASVAQKICSGFNFASDLQAACETEDMAKIKTVLLAYKRQVAGVR